MTKVEGEWNHLGEKPYLAITKLGGEHELSLGKLWYMSLKYKFQKLHYFHTDMTKGTIT